MDKNATITALKGDTKKEPVGPAKQVVKALGEKKSDKYNVSEVSDPWLKKIKKGVIDDMAKLEIHTPEEALGLHIMLDCLGMNPNIDDEADIKDFFQKLIEALDMTPLTEFFSVRVDDKETGRGISAFQMITTSHIAMHFDDAGHNGYLDVFSCKLFDPKIVVKMIKDHFKPKDVMIQVVFRDTGLVKGKIDGVEINYEMHNTL